MSDLRQNSSITLTTRLQAWSRAPLRGLLVISLAILFLLICVSPRRANIDTGMITEMAIKLVAGQQPYVDFVEFDLPTIFYVHVPAVYMSRLLSMNVMAAF